MARRAGYEAAGAIYHVMAHRAMVGRGAYRDEKALLAWLLRKLTSVSRDWVAERLSMGHPTSVSRAAARVRSEGGLAKRGSAMEKMVLQHITD